jgi:putative membrane protein
MEGTTGIIAMVLITIVAIEHLYILWMEMFAWETVGKRTFKSLPTELFGATKSLAANQGLYNGFLAAGLIWSLCIDNLEWQRYIALFFLGCVIIAAIFGAVTASKSILIKQGIPAILALIFVLLTYA